MKKVLLLAAIAALTLASCQKQGGRTLLVDEGKPVEVTVSIHGNTTKVTETTYANESKVNTLQVLVFNGEDREAYRTVDNSMTALVPATAGERTVWALVNAPDASEIMTLSALKAAASKLSDNAIDGFVMTGSVTQELTDGGNVPIQVKRQVARVSIAKISTAFEDYRESYTVDVKGIYLINVPAEINYEISGDPADWANKLGHNDADYDALLYDALSAVNVKNGTDYEKEHAFYPYPNPFPKAESPDTYADEWNPRGSLLVLDVTMHTGAEDIDGYYPIVLPPMERNKTYIIEEVCLKRLPGNDPYKPIETGEAKVTITVADWELGLNMGTINI